MDLIRRIVTAPREVTRLQARTAALERELADERRAKERARHVARHDVLTGLPNRLGLTEQADRFLATPQPAVAMMDLDRFKPINDTLGHATGDAVLVELARRLATQLDRGWLMARLGGDEFAAIRGGPVDASTLVTEADALRGTVAAPMRVNGHRVQVGCSIGMVIAHVPVGLSVLLGRADTALYQSKSLGGQPMLWQPEPDGDILPQPGERPAVRTRDLRRARFGGMSVLVADAQVPGEAAAVGRARPVAIVGAP